MIDLTNKIYSDVDAAREHMEANRWPNGPYCPHCGNTDQARITAMKGKAHRPGLYNCQECRQQFSVTVGTVFERSKVPLNKWVLATHLLAASKKGMSAHQLHRMLGVSYKTAWFMAHRIREAMRDDCSGPMGGGGQVVEADETYISKKDALRGKKVTAKGGGGHKCAVVALVERGGKVRTFHVPSANKANVEAILRENVQNASTLYTDESRLYGEAGKAFAEHSTVKHTAGEYARGPVHTNTVEGYFSIFKRGMTGVYQHCAEKHLHRYCTEFDFRYSNRHISDNERANLALAMSSGKRLTYRRTALGAAIA